MNLKTYVEYLQKLISEDPTLNEATVYFSVDDEGNGYQRVSEQPSVRFIEEGTEDNYYQDSLMYDKEDNTNVAIILIN